MKRRRPTGRCLVLLGALFAGACSRGAARIEPPELDPHEAAARALQEYDKDHSGGIGQEELEASPGLKMGAPAIDGNRDGQLTADEIAARIEHWRKSRVALVSVVCSVVQRARPLAGATVTFVPEAFLGSSIKPASGTSDSLGRVNLTVEGEKLQGLLHCGFYRVKISKTDAGKELIAARYNADTVLGEEISDDSRRRKEPIVYDVAGN